MSRINLLPWREWERERRNRTFLRCLSASGAAALVVALLAGAHLDHLAARQDGRADFLRRHLAELDERIAEAGRLRDRREELAAQLAVLRALRDERSAAARMLHELARTIAPGTHYVRVARGGDVVTATGTAESPARISLLMRRLAASESFGSPALRGIHEDRERGEYGGRAVRFDLTFPWLSSGRHRNGGPDGGPRPAASVNQTDGR